METKKTQTIGEAIDKEVASYKDTYKVLVEVGNKHPASVIASEIALQIFKWQEVARGMRNFFDQERAKLSLGEDK